MSRSVSPGGNKTSAAATVADTAATDLTSMNSQNKKRHSLSCTIESDDSPSPAGKKSKTPTSTPTSWERNLMAACNGNLSQRLPPPPLLDDVVATTDETGDENADSLASSRLDDAKGKKKKTRSRVRARRSARLNKPATTTNNVIPATSGGPSPPRHVVTPPPPVDIMFGNKVKDADHSGNLVMLKFMSEDSELVEEFARAKKDESHRAVLAEKVMKRICRSNKHTSVRFLHLDGVRHDKSLMTSTLTWEEAVPFVARKLERFVFSGGTTPKKLVESSASAKDTSVTATITTEEKVKAAPGTKDGEDATAATTTTTNSTRTPIATTKAKHKDTIFAACLTESDKERIAGLTLLKHYDVSGALSLIKIPPFPKPTSEDTECKTGPSNRSRKKKEKDCACIYTQEDSLDEVAAAVSDPFGGDDDDDDDDDDAEEEELGLVTLERHMSCMSLLQNDSMAEFLAEAGFYSSPTSTSSSPKVLFIPIPGDADFTAEADFYSSPTSTSGPKVLFIPIHGDSPTVPNAHLTTASSEGCDGSGGSNNGGHDKLNVPLTSLASSTSTSSNSRRPASCPPFFMDRASDFGF